MCRAFVLSIWNYFYKILTDDNIHAQALFRQIEDMIYQQCLIIALMNFKIFLTMLNLFFVISIPLEEKFRTLLIFWAFSFEKVWEDIYMTKQEQRSYLVPSVMSGSLFLLYSLAFVC